MNEYQVDAQEFTDGVDCTPAAYCAATEAAEPQGGFNAMIDPSI